MIYNSLKDVKFASLLISAIVLILVVSGIEYYLAHRQEQKVEPVNKHVAEIPIDNLK